jgi:general secretion pathway protein B
MSFILDALKKAEAERQRQTGPTLLEVRVAQPRRRFPTWTLVIGALLVINIVLLIDFELRRPAPGAEPPAGAIPAASAPVAAAPAAAPATPVAPAAAPTIAVPPPALAPATAPGTNAATVGNAAVAGNTRTAGPSIPPDAADQSGDNPADFEPAVSPGGSPASAANSSSRRARPPSLSDVAGEMPDLRLDLHVYAVRPADRYALINMHRVHEGDVLPEGARVVAIDRDGVELTYHGTDFMLHPQ